MDKGTYHQACLPEFNPWNPHGEEKNQLNLSSDLHVCTIVQLQEAHDLHNNKNHNWNILNKPEIRHHHTLRR